MPYFIALDVGGTKIEGILVNEKLKVIKRLKRPTEAGKSRGRVVANIMEVIKALDSGKVKAIGFSMAGFVDRTGKLRMIHNVPSLQGIEFRKVLSRLTGKKVVVENDGHCLALSESKLGAAKGKKHVIGIILGTGVGGGLVLDGRIYRGSTGGAGHLGHITVDRSGFRCGCGQLGHFESWCSGPNIVRRYRLYGGRKLSSADAVFRSREKAAVKATNDFIDKAGLALAGIINAFSPEIIVVGGGVSRMNGEMYARLRASVKRYQYEPIAKNVKIRKSVLGDSSGIYGAAILAMR